MLVGFDNTTMFAHLIGSSVLSSTILPEMTQPPFNARLSFTVMVFFTLEEYPVQPISRREKNSRVAANNANKFYG